MVDITDMSDAALDVFMRVMRDKLPSETETGELTSKGGA